MRNRIFFKLLAAFLIVILAAAVTFDVMLGGAWEASLRNEIERNLIQKTQLLAHRVETDRSGRSLADIAAQEGQSAGARVTIIDPTGKVLADSEATPKGMENHAARPEFAAALDGRIGSNERRSTTLGIPFLYVAVPVSGGAVRLAYPLSDVEEVSAQVRRRLELASGITFLFALIVAAAAAQWSARRLERIVNVAARIAEGDLQARIANLRRTKSAGLPAPSIRPPVASNRVLPPCNPASASSKLCSTACRMRLLPSAPMGWCSGPTSR